MDAPCIQIAVRDIKKIADDLTPEERLKIMDAICSFVVSGEAPYFEDRFLRNLFGDIRETIVSGQEQYKVNREKKRKAAERRWASQSSAMQCNAVQSDALQRNMNRNEMNRNELENEYEFEKKRNEGKKIVQEQLYEQRENKEHGLSDTPEWVIRSKAAGDL